MGSYLVWQPIWCCTKKNKGRSKDRLKDKYQYFILVLIMNGEYC